MEFGKLFARRRIKGSNPVKYKELIHCFDPSHKAPRCVAFRRY